MATVKHETKCQCGGNLEEMDRAETSVTAVCANCGHATLIIANPRFSACIYLADFHRKRGNAPLGRPLSDLTMATGLYQDLALDRWPSPATVLDFGIDSSSHLGALQFAVGEGITPYDLDRVLGDGPAITQLVTSVPGQPYAPIVFRTTWDGVFLLMDLSDG
jgi:hypothetical protein